MKVTRAKRLPPGDRWQKWMSDAQSPEGMVFESLTECLNQIYLSEGITKFEVDAGAGEILIDDGKEAPKAPPKTWDLYGEKNG